MNKKTFEEIMKSWGRKNQKLPPENFMLKNKILSKAPLVKAAIFKDNENDPKKHQLPWVTASFAAMSILFFLGNIFLTSPASFMGNLQNVPLPTAPSVLEEPSFSSDATVTSPEAPYSYEEFQPEDEEYDEHDGGVPITDRREFLKTSYNADIRTRKVLYTMGRIEIIVRGLGGRIDSSSGGEEYGYISYAIPAEKLEAFKREIRELAGRNMFTDNTSSENQLSEKQAIEKDKKRAESEISSLDAERSQIIKRHKEASGSYEQKISALGKEEGLLQREWQNAQAERRSQINYRLAQILSEKNSLRAKLNGENRAYQSKLSDVDRRIAAAKSNLGVVEEKDKDLMAYVATVNGSISLNWISLWDAADLYVPGPLIAWLLLLAAIASYIRYRMVRKSGIYYP